MEPIVQARDFSLWYGDFQALIDVNLSVPPQRVTAIIGPSGCGKSTFLRSVNRLNDAIPGVTTSGSLSVGKTKIYEPSTEIVGLRREVGIVFQRPNPFPLSVYDNVAFGLQTGADVPDRDETSQRVVDALEEVGLMEDLGGDLEKKGTSLSLEQQQRLCIARCLPTQPEVLLMDEPCSALDPEDTERVERLIRKLKKTVTVVIVTHNLQQAGRISDICSLFHLGRVVETSKTREIFHNPQEKLTRDFITGRYG
ncbi:phosphate ABC transporter ATP-binding protein [bacterium]|nr:phosphate ABC transporter ATP-binding protein [bacterium]